MVASIPEQSTTGTFNCVIAPHLKNDIVEVGAGKYGRLFPGLSTPTVDDGVLMALGRSGAVMDDARDDDDVAAGDNHCIPAGFTFLGQFIAHDITADRSLLQRHEDLSALTNARTPSFNLEAVYVDGPTGSPYVYDMDDPDKLLRGVNDAGRPDDLPRNSQGRALVGDPRNDVHQFVANLHVAFLAFHNRVVDHVRARGAAGDVFTMAQRLVRWHYQWIVAHEFLPLTCGEDIVADILAHGRRYYTYGAAPYIPVEFADAAYRFGHSQIRALYRLNERAEGRVFPDCAGGCPLPADHVLDWRYFFNLDPARPPQPTRRIDARLVHPLIDLPAAVVGDTSIPEQHSLAYRDLQRGRALDLPSGEAIAHVMGVTPLTSDELGLARLDLGWTGETPLWYYILKESEVRQNGERLGEVGGRIVAEVLLGILDGDPTSYRGPKGDLHWTPALPGEQAGHFTMADLLRFAGVADS